MVDNDSGPEPTGWELMRAIRELTTTVSTFATTYVPLMVHQILAQEVKDLSQKMEAAKTAGTALADKERDARNMAVDRAKSEADSQIAALRKEIEEAKKQRSQLWAGVALLGLGGIANIIFGIFGRGLGVGQ